MPNQNTAQANPTNQANQITAPRTARSIAFDVCNTTAVALYHAEHLIFLLTESQAKITELKKWLNYPEKAFYEVDTYLDIALIYACHAKDEILQQQADADAELDQHNAPTITNKTSQVTALRTCASIALQMCDNAVDVKFHLLHLRHLLIELDHKIDDLQSRLKQSDEVMETIKTPNNISILYIKIANDEMLEHEAKAEAELEQQHQLEI